MDLICFEVHCAADRHPYPSPSPQEYLRLVLGKYDMCALGHSSFPTPVIFLIIPASSPAPAAELKSIKHPNILLNMSGLCLLKGLWGNYGNNSNVRGEARGPERTRSALRAAAEGLAGGQGMESRLSLGRAVKHLRHTRGREDIRGRCV